MSLNLFVPAGFPGSPTPLRFSPLVLADRLITLAQEADNAGFVETASGLVDLAYSVLEAGPGARH